MLLEGAVGRLVGRGAIGGEYGPKELSSRLADRLLLDSLPVVVRERDKRKKQRTLTNSSAPPPNPYTPKSASPPPSASPSNTGTAS